MTDQSRSGVLAGLSAYGLWGAMPVYFLALAPAGPWEILAHRVVWSLVFCTALLLVTRQLRATVDYLRNRRHVVGVSLAGLLIAANWTIYIIAVTSGRITEAALGYFLNPLFSVALGLVILRERLRRLQWVAVLIGLAGASYLSIAAGAPSWIAIGLAFSFGMYGLLKKQTGVNLGAVPGLTAETLVLAPAAVAVLIGLSLAGQTTFAGHGQAHSLLLLSTGVATAVPLLLFAAAARRVSLVTVGLMQFVAPVLQFIAGLALGEHMSRERWIGFAIVWVALLVLMVDILRTGLRRHPDSTRTMRRRKGHHDVPITESR